MDKLWNDLAIHQETSLEVEIIKELFFSKAKRLEEIRDDFDKWSISDLKSLSESYLYSPTLDQGESASWDFGEPTYTSYHPHRENVITNNITGIVWGFCSKKKKFF